MTDSELFEKTQQEIRDYVYREVARWFAAIGFLALIAYFGYQVALQLTSGSL